MPVPVELEVPVSVELEVPVSVELEVPVSVELEVPVSVELEVPVSVELEVPVSVELEVPVSVELEVPVSVELEVAASTAVATFGCDDFESVELPESMSTRADVQSECSSLLDIASTHSVSRALAPVTLVLISLVQDDVRQIKAATNDV